MWGWCVLLPRPRGTILEEHVANAVEPAERGFRGSLQGYIAFFGPEASHFTEAVARVSVEALLACGHDENGRSRKESGGGGGSGGCGGR